MIKYILMGIIFGQNVAMGSIVNDTFATAPVFEIKSPQIQAYPTYAPIVAPQPVTTCRTEMRCFNGQCEAVTVCN